MTTNCVVPPQRATMTFPDEEQPLYPAVSISSPVLYMQKRSDFSEIIEQAKKCVALEELETGTLVALPVTRCLHYRSGS